MSRFRPRAAHIPFVLLGVYVVLVLATSAWVRMKLWDDRVLEAAIYDNSWLIQMPWRADHGEWVGRDFVYPLGPLWQWLSWAASGFRFSTPERALAGMEVLFPLLSLVVATAIVLTHLSRNGTRFAALLAMTAFILFSPKSSIRYVTSLALLFVFLRPELTQGPGRDAPSFRDKRLWSWALGVSAIATVATLLSFERGVMAVASLGAMMAYLLVLRRTSRQPLRPLLTRFSAVVAAMIGLQIVLALVAGSFGASSLAFFLDSFALSRSYTTGMPASFNPEHGPAPESVYAVALCAGAAALVFSLRRFRDAHAAALLAGALPLVVTAMVRSDVGHVWQGIVPAGAALAVVGLMQMERERVGRFLMCIVPATVMTLGWYGSFGGSEKNRLLLLDAWHVMQGNLAADAGYETNLTRVVRWTKAAANRGELACVGASQGYEVVHALANVPGPTETMLRWSPDLQRSLAERIRRDRCPYFIQDLPSFVYGAQNFYFGDDFLTLAELYEPTARLGPALFVTKLRSTPAPAHRRDAHARGLGAWREASVPGKLEVQFARPLAETDLLLLDYTISAPDWVRYVGGTPKFRVAFASGDEDPWVDSMVQFQLNERTRQLISVHSWAAEWRWLVGQSPHHSRTADRMRIEFFARGNFSPRRVSVNIHSIEVLSPGSATLEEMPGEPIRDGDLITALERGRAYPVSSTPKHPADERGFVLTPNNDLNLDAQVVFPLKPRVGAVFAATIGLDRAPAGGDGADVELELIDPQGDPIKRPLAKLQLEPNAEPIQLTIPVDPWFDRNVMLRLTSHERKSVDYDWVRIKTANLSSSPRPATVAGALRAGLARSYQATPRLEGADVFLHPGPPGGHAAEVVVPLRPRPDDCVHLGLAHRGKSGDGVTFTTLVRGVDGDFPLLLEHVAPDTRHDAMPGLSLADWAGRNVELVLATTSGRDSSFDWAYYLNPRVADGGCGLTRQLAHQLTSGNGQARGGNARVDQGAIVLSPEGDAKRAEVSFQLQPEQASCLSASISSKAGPAQLAVLIEEHGEANELYSERLSKDESRAIGPIPLARWAGRPVQVVLAVSLAQPQPNTRARFDAPVIRRCP